MISTASVNSALSHLKNILFRRVYPKLCKGGWHTNCMTPLIPRFNSRKARSCWIMEVILNSKNINRKLRKALWILAHNIASPTCPNSRETSTVSYVILCAQLMLNCMRSKIAYATSSGKSAVRKRRCPEQICTCSVILWLFDSNQNSFFYGTQESLGKLVGECHVLLERKVALHGVHHDICAC